SGTNTFMGNLAGNTLIGGAGRAVAAYGGFNGMTVDLQIGLASSNGSRTPDQLQGITYALVSRNNHTPRGGGGCPREILSRNNNTLSAGGTTNVLKSDSGSNTLLSTVAGNTLMDLTGQSVASYAGTGLSINLATGVAATGTNPSDTLVGIVNATVSGTSDTLVGGSGNGTLNAHGTGDTLIGACVATTLIRNVSSNVRTEGSGI